MSTPTPQSGPPPAQPAPAAAPAPVPRPPHKRQVVIVSHSTLFYWWPVWVVGFLMTIISAIGDHRMATVPAHTKLEKRVEIPGYKEPRTVLVFPKEAKESEDLRDPYIHVSPSKNVGIVFVAFLLLVVAITNIPLRGLWSFIVILVIVFLIIIFSILEWWRTIFDYLNILDIRINMAGYFVISFVLFVLWLFVFFLFDQQIYMIIEPGQLRVRQAIGDAEMSYDTTGMTTQKQRSDLFRHWVLGLGSGDLIVKTAGAHPVTIEMDNVLFIGRKHKEIEELLRAKEVVSGSL
jgi:hypothetical protein